MSADLTRLALVLLLNSSLCKGCYLNSLRCGRSKGKRRAFYRAPQGGPDEVSHLSISSWHGNKARIFCFTPWVEVFFKYIFLAKIFEKVFHDSLERNGKQAVHFQWGIWREKKATDL